ncbi:MAG: hypothetical protein A2487_14375 [Candidatus Raymondbacteria bacterium RifOxyC12_full_50_8]|nr:MAG: hypothetical protein A2487_14375 [Candidatus Raymondbacteria bacterium RifOxyC12_full_50_8]OGP41004.1 MAG: hypothetical protein A2324_05955 [Candidatus Raymondbacteria bacterium RIFOXYB2_FULL_49_35]
MKVVVDPVVSDTAIARRVLSLVPCAEVVSVPACAPGPHDTGSTLFLMNNPGPFVKKCPETPQYVCCGYRILNIGTGCPIGCTYCILNEYLGSRAMSAYCNTEPLFRELAEVVKGPFLRLGSGEFTDSLVLDHLTGLSADLIPFLLKQRNLLFEFKTKTVNINNLIKYEVQRKIMASWSVNPDVIVKAEEHGAPSLEKRLAAARECMKKGYIIGFHFDPIIKHDNWEENYTKVVDLIYQHVEPSCIGWISLGCFRFVPALKPVVQRLYPHTKIIYEEFVQGKDRKMRYFRPLREHIYDVIISRIKKYHPDAPVYFCMETPAVWERVLGKKTFSSDGLCGMLDEVREKFGLD